MWDKVRTTLEGSGVPKCYWNYCLDYVIYVYNRTPQQRLGWRSPYQMLRGTIPDISLLRPFGCVVYCREHGDTGKLDSAGIRGVFLGISAVHSDAYIIGIQYPSSGTLTIRHSTDVVFKEGERYFVNPTTSNGGDSAEAYVSTVYVDPISHSDAMSRPGAEAELWAEAEDAEWYGNVVGVAAIPVPEAAAIGHLLLPTKIVYKKKPDKYKARIVVLGNLQKKYRKRFMRERGSRPVSAGESDYSAVRTFAPTIPVVAVRVLLSLYGCRLFRKWGNKFVVRSGDVTGAFCLAKLPTEYSIFIKAPIDKYCIPGTVWKLVAPLYGLEEAPHLWFLKFQSLLVGVTLIQSEVEQCMFFAIKDDLLYGVVMVFVDDVLFLGHVDLWNVIVTGLTKEISFKDLGQPDRFLGMELTFNSAGLYISHHDYIQKILDKYGFSDANGCKTPMESGLKLEKLASKISDPSEYQQLVGSLIHTSTYCHPDIAFAVKEVSKHLLAHNEHHFRAVKRIFRYLKQVQYGSLFVKKDQDFRIEVYVDSDWASAPSRRSTTGIVILINGMSVGYYSKEQKSIALSSCEAEVFALSQAIRLLSYVRSILEELLIIDTTYTIPVYCDSQSAIAFVSNEASQAPAKHIDIRLKHVQEQLSRNRIELIYIPTSENLADLFTKALNIDSHHRHTSRLMSQSSFVVDSPTNVGGVLN